MGSKKQYFGIKFPFTSNNENGFFIDLNETIDEKVGSEIAHLILTPKGTRIMMPNFGTNLIKYLFNPNDNETWGDVEEEIISCVNRYIPNVRINKVEVLKQENEENTIFIDVHFSVKLGETEENILIERLMTTGSHS